METAFSGWAAADYGLPPDVKLPEFSLYMSPPGTCELLREVYRQVRPEVVIEFGSGISTLVFCDLINRDPRKAPGLCTIENDAAIADDTDRALFGTLSGFRVAAHAPIEDGWYSRTAIRSRILGAPDLPLLDYRLLAFVDGPSTKLSGPRGRGPAMLLIDELFPSWSGAILLDDVQRLGEAADFRVVV